ncbi:MAG: glycosyltransferase family 4 protein [Elusimicrobia bacterium]|nr:glycosyltransferase family 4 protein [Elusimicrobiota bacterium]
MALQVLHVSESNEWTGGTAQLLALAQGLKERGWGVWLACRPGSGLGRFAAERGLEVFPVTLREDYDLLSAWRLARFIQSRGISVVHAHHNRSHAVCLLAKLILKALGGSVVLVVSRRVSFPPGKNPFSRWKYQSRLIDKIAAVADAVKEVLVASGVDPERVEVIRSGVDPKTFSPRPPDAELKRALGLPDGKILIGKIANASPWKGQTVFLEAAARLCEKRKDVHFLLAGRDTDGDWIRAEVKRLKLEPNVSLLGFRTDVPRVLSCLSFSVNAAVRGEGLSGALRESLCLGIPALASDIAGNRELLGPEGREFLSPPGNAPALAERLKWALDHQDQCRDFARRWRENNLAQFSLERTISKTASLYKQLVDARYSAPTGS